MAAWIKIIPEINQEKEIITVIENSYGNTLFFFRTKEKIQSVTTRNRRFDLKFFKATNAEWCLNFKMKTDWTLPKTQNMAHVEVTFDCPENLFFHNKTFPFSNIPIWDIIHSFQIVIKLNEKLDDGKIIFNIYDRSRPMITNGTNQVQAGA